MAYRPYYQKNGRIIRRFIIQNHENMYVVDDLLEPLGGVSDKSVFFFFFLIERNNHFSVIKIL